MAEAYRRRRDYMYGRLTEMGMEGRNRRGPFRLFPVHPKSTDGFRDILCADDQRSNWAVPGPSFGADGYIVPSFTAMRIMSCASAFWIVWNGFWQLLDLSKAGGGSIRFFARFFRVF